LTIQLGVLCRAIAIRPRNRRAPHKNLIETLPRAAIALIDIAGDEETTAGTNAARRLAKALFELANACAELSR
jgi:hypothetical protein